jgi:hypothetical protein
MERNEFFILKNGIMYQIDRIFKELIKFLIIAELNTLILPCDSTAKGLVLAALTTPLGFGSLMVSGPQGAFSLRLLATIGSLRFLLPSVTGPSGVLHLVGPRWQPLLPLIAAARSLEAKVHDKAGPHDSKLSRSKACC